MVDAAYRQVFYLAPGDQGTASVTIPAAELDPGGLAGQMIHVGFFTDINLPPVKTYNASIPQPGNPTAIPPQDAVITFSVSTTDLPGFTVGSEYPFTVRRVDPGYFSTYAAGTLNGMQVGVVL
jgi:hypothetical protein